MTQTRTSGRPAVIERQSVIAQGGIEAAVQTIIEAVITEYEEALQWLEDSSDKPGECTVRGATAR
jgi:hypothetical protein